MAGACLRAAGTSRAQVTLKPAHMLLALLVTAIWGFNFVVIKVGVAEVPPLLLTGLRFLLAAVPAVFFIRKPKAEWRYIASFGFALGVVKFGLLFFAISIGLSASLASLVMQLQVFFTIFLAATMLSETPKPVQIAGAAIAFAGIAVIAASRWSGPEFLPLVLSILAALTWGVANMIAKKSGEKDMFGFVIWASVIPPLPLFALSWMLEDHAKILQTITHPSWLALGSIAFLAWPATVFCFGVWNGLLSRYSAATVTPFALLVPVFGIASGVVFLGEPFGMAAILGSGLVFAGLILNVFGARISPAARLASAD
jgi:O-acetylserine/cysteine efflux transporter